MSTAATRDEPELRETSAGRLLVVALTNGSEVVRRYANAAARIAAEYGTERARGWVMGVWYDGGNNRASQPGEVLTTYRDIVIALQAALGVEIVEVL